jgi:hypothetical protein
MPTTRTKAAATKRRARKTTPAPTAPSQDAIAERAPARSAPSHDAIAERAYDIYLRQGSGDEIAHWLRAERELGEEAQARRG